MPGSGRGTARRQIGEAEARFNVERADGLQPPSAPDPEKVAEIARYIAQLTAEMCRMAADVKLETLAYFLSMARLEAEMLARKNSGPDRE